MSAAEPPAVHMCPPGSRVDRDPEAAERNPAADGDLAARQAALVAALVAGGPLPPGFDARRVDAAAAALLRKRAGEVADAWPLLATALGPEWKPRFAAWARGRPRAGSFADGFAFARALREAGALPALAADELAVREVLWTAGGTSLRRWPALRRTSRGAVLQVAGRLFYPRWG